MNCTHLYFMLILLLKAGVICVYTYYFLTFYENYSKPITAARILEHIFWVNKNLLTFSLVLKEAA